MTQNDKRGEVFVREYESRAPKLEDVLRYSGCRTATEDVKALCRDGIKECKSGLPGKVCFAYCEIELDESEGAVVFPFGKVKSRDLCRHLEGCRRAVVFAATVGALPDRLSAKYGAISPSRALICHAVGDARIEDVCDEFCLDVCKKTDRFSPGYGDLSTEFQKDIFRLLDCPRKIGLSLSDGLMMIPTKSVTAIVGLKEDL